MAFHGLGVVAIVRSGLAPAFAMSLCLVVVVHCIYTLLEQVSLSIDAAVRSIRWEAQVWTLTFGDDVIQPATLLEPAWITPLLCIVRFRAPRGRYTVFLCADGVRYDELRRLRVAFNLGYLP